VRPRAERTPGVDDDGARPRRRFLPGRTDPERPDLDPVVEGAPAILPSLGDLGADRPGEGRGDPQGRLAVRGELDLAVPARLLEPLGGELDEARPQDLGLGDRDADRGADQRNALLRRSKKLGSGL
jgi:hypothetical protein